MAALVLLCGVSIAGAAVLSVTHAWILSVPPPRGSRYLFAWSVLTVAGAAIFLARLEPQGGLDRGLQSAAIVLPALTTGAIFWIAGWSRAAARPQDGSLLERAWRLFPTHLPLIIAFSVVSFFVIMFLALGRIH
jgi:hypothetical protein